MRFAAITFAGDAWLWVALAAAVVLGLLAWLALRPGAPAARTVSVALALRALGIGLLLLCLLDPQWTTPRAKKGANLFAIVADNSQSLQITDAGATGSRLAQVRGALTGDGSRWLASLADEFQLRPYVFDRDLRRVRDFTELDATGDHTATGDALKKLRERFTGQPLAGILLFTDGNATDLPTGLGDTNGLPPIYPVIVGSAEGLRDVRIDRADVHQTVFDDAPVSVRTTIAGQGVAGLDFTATVRTFGAPADKAGGNDVLPAAQTVRVRNDSDPAEAVFNWHPTGSGVQFYEVAVTPKGAPLAEATTLNNRRVVMVDRGRPAYRILYLAGMPNFEFKFFNRALADDPQLQMVGLIRVARREPKFDFIGRAGESSNPIFRGFGSGTDDTQRYDQPVMIRVNARDEKELQGGFPRSAAELFTYDAVVLDHVESAFFTTDQLLLLRRFASERGGGLLMLGGVDSLEAGDYANTPLAVALPVYLDRKAPASPQGELTWNLTREGWLEPWTRVRPLEADERERLSQMPHLLVANALNGIKPGATVLAAVTDQTGANFPTLIAQNFGAGRVACLGVSQLWLWGMQSETDQADLAHFWRQFARWLVTDVPAPVELRITAASAENGVTLQVTARDKEYKALDLATARITIHRSGEAPKAAPKSAVADTVGQIADPAPKSTAPAFTQVTLPAESVADIPGRFEATFAPREAGAYLADVEVLDKSGQFVGRAQAGWVNDPAADEFRSLAPNRPLMEELARRTGGQVIAWSQLNDLATLLPKRAAPISETSSEPLWHQSWVFLAVLACFLSEWAWRRWRGLP